MSVSETFCPLPFLHHYAGITGDLHYCCLTDGVKEGAITDHGRPLHCGDLISSETTRNAASLRQVRKQMLEGKPPSACESCHLTEKLGGRSRRLAELDIWKAEIPDILAETLSSGASTSPIRSLDLRLGNYCNLRCRMCSPEASSAWSKEWPRYAGKRVATQALGIEWHRHPELASWVCAQPHLKHIHFGGGEPLLIPEATAILAALAKQGRSRQIHLTYNTNLTKLPTEVCNLWREFRSVELIVSVDGVGELNNYIRYPSQWKHIEQNLQRIESHHPRLHLSRVVLQVTVQNLNLFHVGDLYDYCSKFDFIEKKPFLNPLQGPAYLNIQNLPPGLKRRAEIYLGETMDRLRDNPKAVRDLHYLRRYLQTPGNPRHFARFLRKTRRLDRLRGEDAATLMPEYAEGLKRADNWHQRGVEFIRGHLGRWDPRV